MKPKKFRYATLKLINRPDGSVVTFEEDRGRVEAVITTPARVVWLQSLNDYFAGDKPRLELATSQGILRRIGRHNKALY